MARKLGFRSTADRYIARQCRHGTYCFIHINKCGGTSVERALGLPLIHDTARQRIARLGRDRWDELLTFALVRDPYAKVLSHYTYRVKTGQTGLGDGHIGLSDWVCEAYGAQNPRYHDQPLMFRPCMDWLVDESGQMAVKRVLKLEEIDSVWPAFCDEAFGRQIDLGRHNSTQAVARDKDRSGDRNRLDPAAVAIIRSRFAADFAAFGYDPETGS